LEEDEDDKVREYAALALGRIAPEAASLPVYRHEVVGALAQALQRDTNEEVRWQAAVALRRLGPEARTALPALKTALDDEEKVRNAALRVLFRLGREGVPLLCHALAKQALDVRRAAANYLGEIGPPAKDAVPALLRACWDDHDAVRVAAAESLLRIDPALARRHVVAPLIKVVEREVGSTYPAIMLLRKIGPEAHAAVPALIRALGSSEGSIPQAAAEALGCMGEAGKPAVPALLARLEDESHEVRVAAALALWRLGRRGAAMAALLEEVQNEVKECGARYQALGALAEIGPEASQALPALRRALLDRDDPSRPWVAWALWRIERRVEFPGYVVDYRQDALRALIQMLPGKRASASETDPSWVLRSIGPEAEAAVPALLDYLQNEDWAVRLAAVETLAAIGPRVKDAVPALKALLGEVDSTLRLGCAVAISRIDPQSAPMDVLADLLERRPILVRWLREEMGPSGPMAKPLVPVLLRALRHDDLDVSRDAARLLRQVDPEAAAKAGVP
jgi:HEAT repeat protein